MAVCKTHCPGPSGGLLAVAMALLAAVVAVVVFVAANATVILAGVLAVAAALTAYLVRVLRAAGPMWRPGAVVKAPPSRAVEAPSAPRAIEPRHVIPGVVVRTETGEEVRLLADG